MNLQRKVAYHKSPWAGYTFLAFYSIRIISSIHGELGYICELFENVFYIFNTQKFLAMVLGTWYIFYQMDGWLAGWMDGWMDKWIKNVFLWHVQDFKYNTDPNLYLTCFSTFHVYSVTIFQPQEFHVLEENC